MNAGSELRRQFYGYREKRGETRERERERERERKREREREKEREGRGRDRWMEEERVSPERLDLKEKQD